MTKKIKKPAIAALLNFLFPGIGYVYAGKREIFGIGLILSGVILIYLGFSISGLTPLVWIDSFIMAILFAYDGYKTAEEVNKGK